MLVRFLIFLVINFAALGLGGLLAGEGAGSEWYQGLNQAPWTPPGWVFGAAWTLIMICFSFYMAAAWERIPDRSYLIALYVVQWIFNVGWNPVFFNFQKVFAGLVIIAALAILVGYFLFGFTKELKANALWASPYFIWLVIATSLNGYIYFFN